MQVEHVAGPDICGALGFGAGAAGPECTQQAAALAKLANELGGITKIGELNATGTEVRTFEARQRN